MHSTWMLRPPKADLKISTFSSSSSLSSLSLKESIVSIRIHRRILPSPHCSSSSSEDSAKATTKKMTSSSSSSSDLSVPLPTSQTGRPSPSSSSSAAATASSSLNQKRKKKGWWRGPLLWKRIFFASKKVRSIILLNIVTVIYASDIPVLKEVEQITDPALFTVVRFSVTAILFLPFVLKVREDHQIRSAGMELGFWVSLGYLSQALGLLTSEAGQASFISAFTVIVVPLIDGMFGATVPVITWTGALASLVGVGILESGGSPPCVGDILNIMSAVFFGVHMLRTEQISRNTKKEHFFALLGYQVCVVAFSSVIWFIFKGMIDGESHQLSFGFGSWEWSKLHDWILLFPWIPAIYTGLFSTGLCLWAELDAMRDVSATETAIIYGLEPLWGAAFAWFLLGERWGTTEWIGASFVLCGSLTVQILGTPHEKSPEKGDATSKNSLSKTSNKQSDLSLSRVVVKSRETSDLFRKRQDKL